MASKRRLRRKSCDGKVRHQTGQDAQREIARLHRTKGHQGQLHVYRCAFCGCYHVGHQPGRNGIGSAYRGFA